MTAPDLNPLHTERASLIAANAKGIEGAAYNARAERIAEIDRELAGQPVENSNQRSNPASAAHNSNGQMETTMRPVLVTTEFRGVFFGYADDTSGDNITLTNARNCIYWPSTQGGFAGLASDGPVKGARIGAAVEKIDLRKVTSVTEVTAAAAKAWTDANVYRG